MSGYNAIPVRKTKAAAALVEKFNEEFKVGDEVILNMDSGERRKTIVRFPAYVSGAGQPVAFFNGVSGYYLIDRVERVR